MDISLLQDISMITRCITTFVIIMAVIMILVRYKRYHSGVFVTMGTIAITHFGFCNMQHTGVADNIPQVLAMGIMVNISFTFMALLISRCGLQLRHMMQEVHKFANSLTLNRKEE